MVVVSGTWVKNVPYSPQINENIIIEEHEIMAAKAILACRPNSHPFQDRTLTLDQPVKIGRSVARAKPTPTNAIFDCKVLSRHHAMLCYENGKFYLQDTKSSNGTFVNNNRLSADNHEVSSGDIVQFGVDVVENNRKVAHGCIIATLKLYLPDGKEAKASPSITESDRHGVVPLDDLYKLNQILQEANQREQCLESKLNALQNVVEETKKSAEESWQAYVGEERLLSRLSALETQLQQARTNWSEDRLKDEIAKLRESNEQYQEVAKETLEKAYADKLQAVALAMEQERAKISAEQDALLVREQLDQTQLELQEIAQKLTEVQTKAEQEKQEHEKNIRELEQHMEEEESKIIDLEAKIYELTLEISKKQAYSESIEERPGLIFENDLKMKEEMLAENEMITESILNKSNSNGFNQNHINLTVVPVDEKCETEELECEMIAKDYNDSEIKIKEEGKKVSFKLPEEEHSSREESENDIESPEITEQDISVDRKSFVSDQIDSKTLKYQYQSAQREQMELKRKIDILEKISETNKMKIAELDRALDEEKELNSQRLLERENLRQELLDLEQKWREGCNENQQLKDKVNALVAEIEQRRKDEKNEDTRKVTSYKEYSDNTEQMPDETLSKTNNIQLAVLEEEMIALKSKYSQTCEDKMQLQKDLLKMKVEYEMLCDSIYNKYFWYIGPIVLLVLYLLFSTWIS
ncbi:sarcolemmal membrane-associated protein-like isoform X2 [Sitophilus oryzae]|uniref:Sarcolemmal membrane-associated protein-like isoform X2 n=1 Tax=Sitophilus oryzae TaxID=7048 RepID=A0A6J2X2W0_SITOR|nr:sarcolemmal membrane-associated protein-like isoform X2 [Sitophilus oryzae]